MSNTSAIIRFAFSAVICASIIFCGIFQLLFLEDDIIKASADEGKAVEAITYTVEEKPQAALQEVAQITAQTTQSEVSDALPVSASGAVVGSVVERFISPYTANTSFGNVYLKNNTDLTLDLESFVGGELSYKIEKNNEPQVLIMHTHTTESYLLHGADYYTDTDSSRNTDNNYNMAAIGKIVADKLNAAGITTLHNTTAHDYPSYNESYSRAAKTVSSYLKQYPSIKVVIDLHRDAIAANDTDKVKVVTEIEGKKAAQIMLVMGSQSGNVKNFPNWQENLKLATKIQSKAEQMYPTLARSIHFMPKNYNQSLSNGSVLIEIGTDGNTINEAKYSAELLGNVLVNLFSEIG